MTDTKQKATCWSITINNPEEGEVTVGGNPGWKLQGQYEQGEGGTKHFQGMITTPHIRFSQVKRQFPRAHIEIARNRGALAVYVNKEETRVGEYNTDQVKNMFQAQDMIAGDWDQEEYDDMWNLHVAIRHKRGKSPDDPSEIAMKYLDELVDRRIRGGEKGIEMIAVNPMWRSSWKRFYAAIITRHARQTQDQPQTPSTPEEGPAVQVDEGRSPADVDLQLQATPPVSE